MEVGLNRNIIKPPSSNELSHYHRLTNLPNRSLFSKKMAHILNKSDKKTDSAAVMLIDVDNFMDLNNAYGYKFGNKLLRNIAEMLSICFHRNEVISHFERDCFALFVPNVKDIEEAGNLAKKIMKMFYLPWSFDKHECYSTVSIGISMYPYNGRKAKTLIKNAESALYYAKKQGRDKYLFYSKDIDENITKRLSIENNLRKAIENKEFTVYYQPQIDIATGGVVALEALARWVHPTKGIILPSVFIPIAEETGLINPIGEWVLETACKQVHALNNMLDSKISLAVNLSPCQFQNPNLSESIFKIIEGIQFSPELLEIEVTEEAAIKDINATIKLLKELGKNNIKIALDDFCTGYSSLCYLELLPINKIKIDKSFVAGMNENHKKEAIIECLINLAHKLNTVIVAEGVEEKSQFDALKSKNCDIAQGYYFSKPLPYEELVRLICEKDINKRFSA